MKNTKTIALLIAAFTVISVSAELCRDRDGNPISCTGSVVRGAGRVAGDATEGIANIFTLGGVSRAKERESNRSKQIRRNNTRDMQEEEEQEENEAREETGYERRYR